MSAVRRPVPIVALVVVVATLAASCAGNELRSDVADARRQATTTTAAPTTTTTTIPGVSPTLPTPEPPGPETGFPPDWQPTALVWAPCDRDVDAECASLTVPLDWSMPDGDIIQLAVARYRSKESGADRIGSLVANPGGPGGSGLDLLFANPFPQEALAAFDLVSWDPRGIGESTNFDCSPNIPDFIGLDPDPDTPDEELAIETAAENAFTSCTTDAEDRALLEHVGTADTARDLEALRRALGDTHLTFFGFSYGTYIAERYLQWFPTTVRAMVLDGVVDPTMDLAQLLEGQTAALDAALGRILDSCDASAGCELGDASATYDGVRDSLEAGPMNAPVAGRKIGPADLAAAATYATYDQGGWNEFLDALAQAKLGDGDGLARMTDAFRDNAGFTPYTAITCLDLAAPQGQDAYTSFVDGLRIRSPRLGGGIGNEMRPCATWPVPAQADTAAVVAPKAPDILLVGNRGDPATPYDWAVTVAETLERGHLLTYEGEGHTSYGKDECVDTIIHRYLLTLAVPPEGATCSGGGSTGGQA